MNCSPGAHIMVRDHSQHRKTEAPWLAEQWEYEDLHVCSVCGYERWIKRGPVEVAPT